MVVVKSEISGNYDPIEVESAWYDWWNSEDNRLFEAGLSEDSKGSFVMLGIKFSLL